MAEDVQYSLHSYYVRRGSGCTLLKYEKSCFGWTQTTEGTKTQSQHRLDDKFHIKNRFLRMIVFARVKDLCRNPIFLLTEALSNFVSLIRRCIFDLIPIAAIAGALCLLFGMPSVAWAIVLVYAAVAAISIGLCLLGKLELAVFRIDPKKRAWNERLFSKGLTTAFDVIEVQGSIFKWLRVFELKSIGFLKHSQLTEKYTHLENNFDDFVKHPEEGYQVKKTYRTDTQIFWVRLKPYSVDTVFNALDVIIRGFSAVRRFVTFVCVPLILVFAVASFMPADDGIMNISFALAFLGLWGLFIAVTLFLCLWARHRRKVKKLDEMALRIQYEPGLREKIIQERKDKRRAFFEKTAHFRVSDIFFLVLFPTFSALGGIVLLLISIVKKVNPLRGIVLLVIGVGLTILYFYFVYPYLLDWILGTFSAASSSSSI